MALTEHQIKRIPKLVNEEHKTLFDIAAIFDCHINTITYWVKRLREQGVKLNIKKGPPYRQIKL